MGQSESKHRQSPEKTQQSRHQELIGVPPLEYQWIQPPEALRSGKTLVGVPLGYEPMQFHPNVPSSHRPRSPPPHYYQQQLQLRQHPVGAWDAPWNQLLDIDFSVDNVRSHLNNIDQDLNQAFQSIGMDRSKARRHSGSLVQTDWVENDVYNLKIPIYINVEPGDINVEVDHGTLCISYKTTEKVREGEASEEVYKKIPLPDNVNERKVRCIHKPQGYLFIEAPLKTESELKHVQLKKDTSRVSQFGDKVPEDTSKLSPSREKENIGQSQQNFGQGRNYQRYPYRGYTGPQRQFGTWADVVEKGRPEGPPRRRFGEFQYHEQLDQLGQRDRRDLNLPIPPERAGLSPPRETSVYIHRTGKQWPSLDKGREHGERYPHWQQTQQQQRCPSMTEKAGEKLHEATEKVGEGWDKTKEKVGEGYEKTKDTLGSGWEKTKDTVESGYEKTKDTLGEGWERVKEGAEAAKEKVKEGAEKVKDTLTPSESHEQPKYRYETRQYQPGHYTYQQQYPHKEEKPLTTKFGEVLQKPLDAYAEGMHKIEDAVAPSEETHHYKPVFEHERKYGQTVEGARPQRWDEFDNKSPRSTEGIQRPLIPTSKTGSETHHQTHWEKGNLGHLQEDRPPHEQHFHERHEQHRFQQQSRPQVISPRSDVSEESVKRSRRSASPEGKTITEKIGEVLQKPLDVYAEGMHKIEDAVTPSETHEQPRPHLKEVHTKSSEKPEKESKGVLETIGDKLGKAKDKIEETVMPSKSDEKEKSPSKDTQPLHKERHEVRHEEWPRGEQTPPVVKHEEKHYHFRHEQEIPSGPGPMEHKQRLHGQGQGQQLPGQGLTGRPPIPEMTEHHHPYLQHPTERTDIRPEHRTMHKEEHHETKEQQGPLFLTGPQQHQQRGQGQEEKGIGEKISEKAHDAKEAVIEGAHTVKEKVKEGAEKVKEGAQKTGDKIQEGWEKTKDKVSEGAEKVLDKAQEGKEKVQEGWEKTKDKAHEGKEKVKEKAQEGKEKLQQGWEDTKDKAHEGKEMVKEKAHEGKEKVKEGAEKAKQKAQQGAQHLQQKGHEGKQQIKGAGQQIKRDVKETGHEIKERPAVHRQVEHLRKSPEKTNLPKPEKTGKGPFEKRESPEKESKPLTQKIGEKVSKAADKVSQGFETAKEKVKEAVTPSEEEKHKKQVHKPEAHIKDTRSSAGGILKPQSKHMGERVGEGVRKFEQQQQAGPYENVPRPFVTVETRDEPQGEYTKVTVDVAQGQKRVDPKTTEYSKAAIDVTKGGMVKEKGKDFSPSAV